MYGNAKEEETVTQKLQEIRQTSSAIVYITEFQLLLVQVKWNEKALMAQYKKGLKSKVLDILVLTDDPEDIRDLINKIIRINNRIYQ